MSTVTSSPAYVSPFSIQPHRCLESSARKGARLAPSGSACLWALGHVWGPECLHTPFLNAFTPVPSHPVPTCLHTPFLNASTPRS